MTIVEPMAQFTPKNLTHFLNWITQQLTSKSFTWFIIHWHF